MAAAKHLCQMPWSVAGNICLGAPNPYVLRLGRRCFLAIWSPLYLGWTRRYREQTGAFKAEFRLQFPNIHEALQLAVIHIRFRRRSTV